MFFLDDRLVLSPSDLRLASACEFALLRSFDVLAGRVEAVAVAEDAMLARVSELGDLHEQAELRRLARLHPGGVRSMPRAEHSRAGYEAAMAATLATLDSDAQVISQATFFDGGFLGYADFLERTDSGWLVSDTKLARSDNVPALLQIAAYAAQLTDAGVPVAPVARLVLGSGDAHDHRLSDILPVYRRRRARLESMLEEHRGAEAAAAWGDERWIACGRCEVCDSEVISSRDLLLVAGMRATTRRRLLDEGITTIEELAASHGEIKELDHDRVERLRAQARLQLAQEADPEGGVKHEVIDEMALKRLPTPSAGDIFFDFEGDPLWTERGSTDWGLEYLFGLVEIDSGTPEFTAFWAHDRAEEKKALQDFVAHVQERLQRWPDLHIYHYAPYETAALTRLAARHATCEEEIDAFLRAGLFVDLYATVRAGVRVSQRSYSIKKLEPLYMVGREADLKKGDDSIVEYHLAMAQRDAGDEAGALARLDGIRHYNEEDCRSTWLLRDWLIAQTGDGVVGFEVPEQEERPVSPKRAAQLALEASVRSLIESVPVGSRSADDWAVAMVGASVLFHAREEKPHWWRHYDRIKKPVAQWMGDQGIAVVKGEIDVEPVDATPGTATGEGDGWFKPKGARVWRRRYSVVADPRGGTLLGNGPVVALYAAPADFPPGDDHDPSSAHVRSTSTVSILRSEEVLSPNGRMHQRLWIEENAPGGVQVDSFPVAFVPGRPVGTDSIDAALDALATRVRDGHPDLALQSGIDLLRRVPPRLRDGGPLPSPGAGDGRFIEAITSALVGMDDSYVAVQGPPGTGKTYVGARVIKELVLTHGWKVGVCAQSHAAIENVLDAVLSAGVPAGQVAKEPKHTAVPAWTALAKANDLTAFAAEHTAAGRGYVIGGSAWDLTNLNRVARDQLDLVVIDEAGQFSLAKTLAISTAGARLLLLGDPAQLPQVIQGTHGEPIDESALGWLANGAAVLPPSVGYFLESTWRMHPRLTEVVSTLAYAGQLASVEAVTSARSLEGVQPGLHVRLVDHHDNKHYSPEEADEVVHLVNDLLGRTWTAPDEVGAESGRPLTRGDIIVITPYNNQVGTLKVALREAGHDEVAVGTVDKFQGREAAVAIVSMAASAHGDVSRGMGFLLNRNRLNVAISRGKHAAYLVRSSVLSDFAPGSAHELLALGAFIGLCDQSVPTD